VEAIIAGTIRPPGRLSTSSWQGQEAGYTANVALGQRDPVVGLYRTLVAFAVVGALILTAGLVEFLHFEPLGGAATVHAHIVGVFHYDPATHRTNGPDEQAFARADQFAAVVDWSGLPDGITVEALWFDSFQNVVGSAGPDTPRALQGDTIIPAAVPSSLKYHLPGEYIFTVERLAGCRPVEVLARRIIEVRRT
jgi:hypothetical protein